MKIKKYCFLFFSFFLLIPSAQADNFKFLFFYPGGQGDAASAEGLLAQFSTALKQASDGKIDATVTYLNDLQSGIQFIKTQKPQAAIVGPEIFSEYGKSWETQVIAKTLQLPSSDGTNQYFLLGKSDTSLPTAGKIAILSPRPFESSYVQEKLFPNLKGVEFKVIQTQNPVGELRAIGSGTKSGFVLLDQFEYSNIARLKSAWTPHLKPLAVSQKVPSALVVVFTQNIPSDQISILQNALVQIGKMNEAKSVLDELRMKGFQKASSL